MMGYYGYGPGAGWGLMGAGVMFLFWVFVVLLIIWLVRSAVGHGGHMMHHGHMHGSGHHALEILKERYVKGEINKEEYEAKKKDLES